jgi:predicted transcriptional regulator
MMHAGGYRQVPVVDNEDRILGCVRHKDIAGYLVDHYAAHVLNLPPDPEQVARAPEGG